MKRLCFLLAFVFLVGCNKESSISLPQKDVPLPEKAPKCYDPDKIARLHIPKNCRLVGLAGSSGQTAIIENSSGTQLVVSTGEINTPYIVVKDRPEVWIDPEQLPPIAEDK
jgi:hypothetical protein